MGRALPGLIRIFAMLAALALVHGCRERAQLEKDAPALAHADFTVDRIAVAGIVSNVPSLVDSAEIRESWSVVIGNHFGRGKFGNLPIVPSSEVLAILGRERYGEMLDRYKAHGQCDDSTLFELHTALEGRARFVVLGSIVYDKIGYAETESEDAVSKTKTKSKTTSRTTWVRLRFYDLADQKLVWNHRALGYVSASDSRDATDVIKHGSNEGVLGSLATSIANSMLKPDPEYPAAPHLSETLGKAFDSVGAFLKPEKQD